MDVVSGIKRTTACLHVIPKGGVRMKGVVSFAHGDISIGHSQGGEQQEIADDLTHTLKVGISDALRTSVLKRSSVILTPSRRFPSL